MLTRSRLCRAAMLACLVATTYTCTLQLAEAAAAQNSLDVWRNSSALTLPADAPRPSYYRSLILDVEKIAAYGAVARHDAQAVNIPLPLPEGDYSEFRLTDSKTMPDELQDKFPEIISLAGSDNIGRRARVDISPLGLQAMVFDRDGRVWTVRPETFESTDRYMSFWREALTAPTNSFRCDVHANLDSSDRSLVNPKSITATGAIERTYRVAVAANHQYVAAVGGGTVAGGLAAVVTAMNRVNQVYESELGVHMTLIANNNSIIYASAATDPYSNDENALDENQVNLDSIIGAGNYDIGHVFTTGSGGLAGLNVTCINGQKAFGTTGLSNPSGDAFYVDYVAHELGHQFGGNHTFNSAAGSCGGNRENGAAYEPGSGSTIMAYAGICGTDDLQPHSDPYFHTKSLDEIASWIEASGGACAIQNASVDTAPIIQNVPVPITIPAHTPFILSGSATDADGDTLMYSWEQFDLGPPSSLAQGDTGIGPLFRSFVATTNPSRYFPRAETVLGAALVAGEAWPVTTRDLNFRLTVRDNHDGPGAPQFGRSVSTNNIQIHVASAAGPFTVALPNTAMTWGRGESRNVRWNVAGTSAPPVSCSTVAIGLSTDGGSTFPFQLAGNTANNGGAVVTVPNVPDTSQARVRVQCTNNIFLDVSDVNFSIAAVGGPDPNIDAIFDNSFEGSGVTPQPVDDPSFEATVEDGGSNPFWSGSDSNPGADPGSTPFYSASGVGIPTHTGDWAVWFGGWQGGAEIQTAAQSVVIPNGPRFLNFSRFIAFAPDAPGTLKIRIDGNILSSTDVSAVGEDADYTQQTLNIAAYANGAAHTISFEYAYDDPFGTGSDGAVLIDDVTVDATPAQPTAVHRSRNLNGLTKRQR